VIISVSSSDTTLLRKILTATISAVMLLRSPSNWDLEPSAVSLTRQVTVGFAAVGGFIFTMMLPLGAILCGGGWLQRTIDFVRVSRRRISSMKASSAMVL
jgi:hypothetical protein